MSTDVDSVSRTSATPAGDQAEQVRRRWWLVPLAVFTATRVADAVLLTLLGRSQTDPSTLPVASHRPPLETGRSYADLVANWDGQWYRYVVEHGYPTHLPTFHGAVQENQWAFYPLYPALVKGVTFTGLPFGFAASLVSMIFGALAMCALYHFLHARAGRYGATLAVLALCVAPAGLIWQTAYAESLALFLIVIALGALASRRYGVFFLAAVALSFTRPITLPLAAVAALHGFVRWHRRHRERFDRSDQFRVAVVTTLTGVSFLLWPAVAALVTGRRDAFFVTRRAWQPHGSTGWPTWFVSLTHGTDAALLVVVPVAVAALVFFVLRRPARAWRPELRLWALTYPLYLLGSTTPTSSIFRYAMLSVIPWWPLPEVDEHIRSRRGRWALALLVCAVGIGVQAAWMRWFWVISPAALERP